MNTIKESVFNKSIKSKEKRVSPPAVNFLLAEL
ncbi:hypothetical protein [Azospirillum largimobile]